METARKYYAPVFKSFGAKLVLKGDWEDTTVNAYAYQEGKTWYVQMFGGLARRSEVTLSGFAIVVCHEIGHHVGGFPVYTQNWGSIEGQSDYFATLACAKNIWREDTGGNARYGKYLTEYEKLVCAAHKDSKQDKDLCYRILSGSKSLANLLAYGEKVSIETPDLSQVGRTVEYHPAAQCRLDTMLAGNLCDIEWADSMIPIDEAESELVSCTRSAGDLSRTVRPSCWYAPKL